MQSVRPPDPEAVRAIVAAALAEDRARHDVTTGSLVPPDQRGRATVRYKEPGVVCGLEVAREAFAQLSPDLVVEAVAAEGSHVEVGTIAAHIEGPLAPLLSAERVALNLLQRLSGIATLTRRFVERAAEGGPASIVDTRKTTPGLRDLERYAVRVGGGHNHRNALEDGLLIKDNHLAATAARGLSLAEAVRAARAAAPHTLRVEVEVTSARMAAAAVEAGADIVLLDNMSLTDMRFAVESARGSGASTVFEASGGITLETVREVASTGVDLISVGALTHSAPALDISLDIEVA